MVKEYELEQIRLKKIQAMLDVATKRETISKQPIVLNDNNFSAVVKENTLLVVDFWAAWCGPCRMVAPIIEQLAAEYADKVVFGKINVDENQIVPNTYGIMGIPTIIVFYQGHAVDTIVGACSKSRIETVFKRYMNNY
ncbi:MAG TPA: thioredoxin [Candidatus Sulfotelmatobacter sp.]|nr:thioredoxin [Candidatus Sulfotelmatobacter sp.]